MKKRKILIGLALASAIFSLAACNLNGTPQGSPSESASESAPAASSSSTPAAESSSTPAADSTPSSSNETPEASLGSGSEESSSSVDEDVLTATLIEVVDGTETATTRALTIDEDGKVVRPTDAEMEKDGYQFISFLAGAMTDDDEYDFDTVIDDDTYVYAHYHKVTKYEVLANATGNIYANNFNGTQTPTVLTSSSIKFEQTTAKLLVKNDTDPNFNGDAAVLSANHMGIDFGKSLDAAGLTEIYFEVQFTGALAGEAFAQIQGASAGVAANGEVFGIRVKDDNLNYRIDGGADVQIGTEHVDKTIRYGIYVQINTAEGSASVEVTNAQTGDEIASTGSISVNITSLRGLLFTAKNDSQKGETKKVIDNVAVSFEAKQQNAVVAARSAVFAKIAEYKAATTGDAYASLDKTNARDKALLDLIDAKIKEISDALVAATTEDAIALVDTAWDTFAATVKCVVTVEPYKAAETRVADTVKSYYKAVLAGNNVDLSEMVFSGYNLSGLYADDKLTVGFDVATATISANTTIYAKVESAAQVKLTYTPKKYASGDEWISNGSYKSSQEDAAKDKYSCMQIAIAEQKDGDGNSYNPKQYKETTYLQTPTFADSTKSVTINMKGFTGGSTSRSGYVTLTAYNSNGEAIKTMTIYTPADKKFGDYTSDVEGTVTDIVLTTTEDISYLKFTCNTDGKSYFITALTVTYEKA